MNRDNPFETHYCEYDDWFERNRNVFESELLAVTELLPERGNGSWVEIGVGSGRFGQRLGIDFGVEPALGIASLARKRGIEVIRGCAEDLPLDSGSVDVAFLITTLCFVMDMEMAFQEVWRVLSPGGAALIAFIPKESALGKLYAESPSEDRFLQHAVLRSREEIGDALAGVGFAIERTVQTLTGAPELANERVELPSDGADRGSFVVLRAVKLL